MFFSTATRPTLRNTGRGRSAKRSGSSARRGWKRSVSTPRVQGEMLRKPRRSNSSRMVGVATMMRPEGRWNQRK